MTQITVTSLDAIFEQRNGTTARSNTNILFGPGPGQQGPSQDLANQYMQVSQGGTATAATTNIRVGGIDIATIFTQLGTLVASDIIWGGLVTLVITDTDAFVAGATLNIVSDGTLFDTGIAAPALVNWLNPTGAGIGSDFESQTSARSGDTIGGGNDFIWTSLDTTQVLTLVNLVSGTTKTGTLTLTIREKANITNSEGRKITLTSIVT